MAEQVEIFIIEAETNPVRMSLNGGGTDAASAVVPIGVDTPIDARLIPVLETSAGIKWRLSSEGGTPVSEVASAGGFDADATVGGTVKDVEARLADLTPEQLDAVRAAEADREVPRTGVMKAIDRAIEIKNEETKP